MRLKGDKVKLIGNSVSENQVKYSTRGGYKNLHFLYGRWHKTYRTWHFPRRKQRKPLIPQLPQSPLVALLCKTMKRFGACLLNTSFGLCDPFVKMRSTGINLSQWYANFDYIHFARNTLSLRYSHNHQHWNTHWAMGSRNRSVKQEVLHLLESLLTEEKLFVWIEDCSKC
jgi:hypothetical protein